MIEPLDSCEHRTMVESHFGFREAPFGVTPDPRFFYSNALYLECLAALAYGVKAKKGFMLLTGEVGTGKTILLRKLVRHLETTVKSVFVSTSHLTAFGLVEFLVQDLGLATKAKTKLEVMRELNGYLLRQVRNGQTVALLIDEAQNLGDGALEGLCSLSNLETDNEKLLQIILVGQPELMTKLNKPSLQRIKQRIAIQQRLYALRSMAELEDYIRHRLRVAGYDGPEIFTKEAIEAIWRHSAGTPRLVNIICDNALMLACEIADKKVSASMVTKAASGFQLEWRTEVPNNEGPEMAVASTAKIDPTTATNGAATRMIDRSESIETAAAPVPRINPESETNGTEVKMGDQALRVSLRAPEPAAISPAAAMPPAVSLECVDHMTGATTEAVGPIAPIVSDDQTATLDEKVSPNIVTKAASEFQSEEGLEVPQIASPEIAAASTAGINPETETNGTEVKMGDQALPVSPRAPELAAISPAEFIPTVVSPEFFDHKTHPDTEAMAPIAPLDSNDQIGERDATRRKKLAELTELGRRANEAIKPSSQKRIGLKWKIAGVFTGIMLILCILVIAAGYQLTQRTLRDEFDKRALAIATNLSDAAAGHIVGKDLLALNALARKYTLIDGVAYVFIEDSEGEIVAHTLGTFPPKLRQGLPARGQRLAYRRELSLQEKPVYETSVPVLEGQVGTVHVGFWADAMEKEIQRILLPLIGVIAIVPVIGALLSFFMAHWMVRPIVRLTEVANKVTRGDLEACGECVKSRDEIGDLARSLERMRASLKAAMLRLERASE